MKEFKVQYYQYTLPETKLPILEIMKEESILPLKHSNEFSDGDETLYEVFVFAS